MITEKSTCINKICTYKGAKSLKPINLESALIRSAEIGAGRQNRTDISCVEDSGFTTKLCPLKNIKYIIVYFYAYVKHFLKKSTFFKNKLEALFIFTRTKSMKYFISAIFAGMMISFGGIVYLSCLNFSVLGSTIGSFLFSLGLLTVVARGYDLYTGKIGYLCIKSNTEEYSPTNLAKNLFF